MAKHKKFRDWYEEEERDSKTYNRKDKKRYDRKKSAIQKARRQKAKQKNSYIT